MKNTARIMLNHTGSIVAGSIIVLAAGTLQAQAPNESTAGYVTNGDGTLVVKGSTGICWHNGYWTPAMAILACDPDLVPKPAPPKPAPPPPPEAPKPPPPPPPPVAKTLKLTATDLFEFNKAIVSPQAKELIDREIVDKLSGFKEIKIILVSGHTDRLGSQQYNQRLSEKRAEAVKTYLVSKGVAADKIEATGFGKTSPIKFGCDDKLKRKALIECLAPNRRVVIEVTGIAR